MVILDSYFYQALTISPWNLVKYNILSDDTRGPNLYGTEPFWFYLANGLLNFNVAFIFALISAPLLLISSYLGSYKSTKIVNLIPFYLWLLVFSLQPHKEERFMYVVFPIVCFNASIGLLSLLKITESTLLFFKPTRVITSNEKNAFNVSKAISLILLTVFVILSVLRNGALYHFYSAPIKVYSHLPKNEESTLCIGKEWHRFPSHYFVPSKIRVEFIKSNFDGLLPTKFDPVKKYLSEPEFVNDLNQPLEDRYVDIKKCDYMVDSLKAEKYRGVEDKMEPYYGLKNEWKSVVCYPFLDSRLTKFPARGFYLGGEKIYMDYCLLKRVEI